MSDEQKVKFIWDDSENSKIDTTRNKILGLDKTVGELGKSSNFGADFGKAMDLIDVKTNKLTSDINLLGKGVNTVHNLMNEPLGNNTFSNFNKGIDQASQKLQTLQNQVEKTKKVSAQSGQVNDFGQGFIGSTGIPLGAAAIGAAAGSFVVDFGKKSLEASHEAAESMRVLQFEAKESGISYQKLSLEAQKFGEITLLSNRQAESSFAAIEKFATRAGHADQGEAIATAIANISAARGISPEQIKALTTQLEGGGSKVFEKLLSEKPKEFETGIDGVKRALTEAEKETRNFNAILKEGALFSGEAEKRVNDASSAVDKLGVKFENLKAGFGRGLEPLAGFANSTINEFSNNKSQNPITKQLEEFNKIGVNNIVTLPITLAVNKIDNESKQVADLIFDNRLDHEIKVTLKYTQDFKDAKNAADDIGKTTQKILDAQKNPLGSKENFIYSKMNPLLSSYDERGNLRSGDQLSKVRNQEQATSETEVDTFLKGLESKYQRAASSGSKVIIESAKQDFVTYANLFDSEARYKIQESFAKGISDGAEKGFRLALQNPALKVSGLRNILTDVNKSNDLQSDARQGLTFDIQNKINQSITQGVEKVKELGKTYNSVFNDLYSKTGAGNPIYTAINEGNLAIDKLKENIKTLPPALQKAALDMQTELNANQLFSAKLDNSLEALDLRDKANSLRNPAAKPVTAEDLNKQRRDYLGKGYAKFDDKQIQDVYESRLLNNAFGNFPNNQPPTILNRGYNLNGSDPSFQFNSAIDVAAQGLDKVPFKYDRNQVLYPSDGNLTLNQQSLITSLASDRVGRPVDADLSAQQKLDKQLSIINSSNPINDEQRDAADRRITSLAQNLDPTKLTDKERSQVADAYDRRAAKTEKNQTAADELSKKHLEINGKLLEQITKLNNLAEKEGFKAVIEIVNNSNGAAAVREGTQPNRKDTEKTYNQH